MSIIRTNTGRLVGVIALLSLFLSFQAGRTLFVHTHIDPQGLRTVHSHPFGNPTHQHDAKECQALDVVMGLMLDDNLSVVPEAAHPFMTVCSIQCAPVAADIVAIDLCHPDLRAPPAAV